MRIARQTSSELGVLVAEDKIEGPATTLTFLGIKIDTIRSELRLPLAKLRNTQAAIAWWIKRKGSCTRCELLSLIGKLSYAATVVKPDCTFLRRLINLSSTATDLHHHIKLRAWVRADPGAHLAYKDIAVDSHCEPSAMRVTIKQSKTDPFLQGIHIFLARVHGDLCPVEATMHYLAVRGNAPGPLFLFPDGAPLSRPRLVQELRLALHSAGIDPGQFSGRSCSWHRGLDAYLRYVRIPREHLATVSHTLAE